MYHDFDPKVGQIITFRDKTYEAVPTVDPAIGCSDCAAKNDHPLCLAAGRCGTNDIHLKEKTMTQERPVTQAPGLSAAYGASRNATNYLAAKQAAWDAYADSRAVITGTRPVQHGMPRGEGFDAGFAAGFAARDAVISGLNLRIASLERSPAKQGKLIDVILTSLRDEGPASAETLARRLGRPLNSISPRFAKLLLSQRVHISGGEPALHGKGNRYVYSFGPAPL